MSEEPITFQQMCEVIAEDWNREQEDLKEGVTPHPFTWKEIWDFDLVEKFPALYIPQLYNAAKTQNLIGLLLTDNTCAGIFIRAIEKKEKDNE